jgi:hypothetical protein
MSDHRLKITGCHRDSRLRLGRKTMTAVDTINIIPWWKEPTKDQWRAWVAAWLGWIRDAFDFTIFLLIMLPIAQDFDLPLTAVTAVFTLSFWMRLLGATASGWPADRIGRKKPLMISIAWYSICNFVAGFSPAFWFLFFFRALGHWHVGGVARRCGFGNGAMADPLARLYRRSSASIVGLGALLSPMALGLGGWPRQRHRIQPRRALSLQGKFRRVGRRTVVRSDGKLAAMMTQTQLVLSREPAAAPV